jgi:hypothetical protein
MSSTGRRISYSLLGAAVSLIAAGGVFPGSAQAGSTAKSPDKLFEALPSGKLDIPVHLAMPDSIPKGESVEGVYAEIPEYLKNNPQAGSRYAQIFASKEDAEANNTGNGQRGDTCFMSASPTMNYSDEVRWSGSFSTNATVSPYPRSYNYGPSGASPKDLMTVAAVRVDHITETSDSKAILDTKIVYVDADTLGARLVSEAKTEFTFVQELPGKVKLYALKSDDSVTFLVRRERLPEERNPVGPMFVQLGNQGNVSTSDGCHMTFTMPVKQAAATTAIVQLEALLEIKPMNADDLPNNDVPQGVEMDRPMMAPGMNGQKEARIRPMEIGFSSTWLSGDKAPVLSISHGWTGRERTQAM